MAKFVWYLTLLCLSVSLFMGAGVAYRVYKFHTQDEVFQIQILPDEDAEQAIQQP